MIKLQQKNKKDVELVFISVDSNPKKAIPKFMKKNSFLKFESYVDNKLNLNGNLQERFHKYQANTQENDTEITLSNKTNKKGQPIGAIATIDFTNYFFKENEIIYG